MYSNETDRKRARTGLAHESDKQKAIMMLYQLGRALKYTPHAIIARGARAWEKDVNSHVMRQLADL